MSPEFKHLEADSTGEQAEINPRTGKPYGPSPEYVAKAPECGKLPAAVGRPTDYTLELAAKICDGISRKIPLAKLCDENPELPCPATVYLWRRKHSEFSEMYARAREDQGDYLAEDALTVADDPEIPSDQKRIMVDARKWLASKYNRKYNDKLDLGNADNTPFQITVAK